MKPPPFTYHDPLTLDEALTLLARLDNAKLLAGGQSLMPMLNFRLAQPDHIIDLNRIDSLAGIVFGADQVSIGAMTRQRDIEFDADIALRLPLIKEALLQVGHRQTRNRGTLGGSLCHLDPAAELPCVAAACDAVLTIVGRAGRRDIAFADFPLSYMTPALAEDEILECVTFPLWPAEHGSGFVEFARRHGDFAIVAAAALLIVDADRLILRASLTLAGLDAAPVRMSAVEQALMGQRAGPDLFRRAALMCREIEAQGDLHAPADYRRHLAGVLSRRALEKADRRARPFAAMPRGAAA
jgi:aerobic carbon-monoxide dehydrogenase medium subunit